MYNNLSVAKATIMLMKRTLVYVALWVCMTILHLTNSQECDEEFLGDGFTYPRTFTVFHDGLPPVPVDRASSSRILKECISPEKHAENMINYFSSYGVNLTKVDQNPYSEHDEAGFFFGAYQPSRPYQIHSGSLFDLTKYINTRLHWVDWFVLAKSSTTGPRGTLQNGTSLIYGTFKFQLHGRYFCLQYNSRIPGFGLHPLTVAPIDLLLNNEEWGKGEAIGLVVKRGIDETLRIVFNFPASS